MAVALRLKKESMILTAFKSNFIKKEIQELAEGFEILWIREEYEEPVSLYLVWKQKKCE